MTLEELAFWVLAYIVVALVSSLAIMISSNRYWNKYPKALREMQRLDDELSRQEGRL